jgi:hypothetical protein
MQAQEVPLQAWNEMLLSFGMNDEMNSWVYPDDFAGGWVNWDKLHIAVTSDSTATMSRYDAIFAGYNDTIVYEPARYSLNELNRIRESLFESMRADFPIIGHHVSEQTNQIVLTFSELNDTVERDVKSFLSRTAKQDRTLSDMSISSDLFVFEKGEMPELQNNLVGGMDYHFGTIGACGSWWNGSRRMQGFITHGHGGLREGDPAMRDGVHIGTFRVVRFGRGDFGFVEIEPGIGLTNRVYTLNQHTEEPFIGSFYDPPVGTILNRYGDTTKRGIVRVTAVDQPGHGTSTRLTVAVIIAGTQTNSGDSGGPYFLYNNQNGTATFAGVHQGGISGHVWFTPQIVFAAFEVRT